MLIPKAQYVRDEKHRRFIASLPCLRTKVHGKTQCCHIRIGTGGGTSLKPSDEYCVPLSYEEHAKQHRGERSYWGDDLPRAIEIAKALYANTGNRDLALYIMMGWRKGNSYTGDANGMATD